MTTIELAKRLTRNIRTKDVANLNSGDRLELAGEITAGLTEFFESAPSVWQRTTFSNTIPEKRIISVDLTNGSNAVAGTPFAETDRARSVTIEGRSDEWNEVLTTSTLLDNFLGATGTYEATIWPDAISIQDKVIKRMVGDPRINKQEWILSRDDSDKYEGGRNWNSAGYRRFGTPTRYAIEEGGQSQGSDLVWNLRLDPIPTEELTLRFEALYYPSPVLFSDLINPVEIPVNNNHANLILIPIIEERLMSSPMWVGGDRIDGQVERRAAQARAELSRLTPDFGKLSNQVRTRPGY